MSEAFEIIPSSKNKDKPFNPEHTIIQIILDETGSMNSCKPATISAFNEFIESQKNVVCSCSVSLVKFSTGYVSTSTRKNAMLKSKDINVRTIYENIDIKNIPELTTYNYSPEGGTNLYDAIGTSIISMEKILDSLEYVPNVIQVILTDGEENSSREYRLSTINKMISEKDALTHWNTVYLGANQDAWLVGQSFGLSKGQTMSYSTNDMNDTMHVVACSASTLRSSYSMASASLKDGSMTMDEYNSKMTRSKKSFFSGDDADEK